MAQRRKAKAEIICKLSENPPIWLWRDSSGWVISEGIGKSGNPKNSAYYGENLHLALKKAYKVHLLATAKPNSDLETLLKTVQNSFNCTIQAIEHHYQTIQVTLESRRSS